MPLRIHDLSKTVNAGMKVYPGDPEPKLERTSTIAEAGVSLTRIIIGSHTGTHVDAGSHFLSDGNAVEREPLEKFVGEALVADASNGNGNGHGLTAQDLQPLVVKANDILLLYTGTGESTTDYAYLEPSAARWLVDHRIKCVGIDTLSVEQYGRKDAPVHKLLLSNEIGIVENLTNLKRFVNQRLFFVCLPLPLEGSDGSPARAVLLPLINPLKS